MNNQVKSAFLTAVTVQALHSVEEFIFKLYEVFPPMLFLYRRAPGLAKPAFVVFNLLLVLFGLFCYFRLVLPAGKSAGVVVWIWVGIQFATVAVHIVWAILTGGYHPGLGTVPFVALAGSYLAYALQLIPSTPPHSSNPPT